jgi:glycosyltransferase involved in cell wall biosynthesis
MRLIWFTDTLGDVNGVSRFIQNMAEQANSAGRDLQVVSSTRFPVPGWDNIHNFAPAFSTEMPKYPQLELAIPNVPAMVGYLKRSAPDVVHVSTPGPVGMAGFLAARRMRLPILGTYHTDFPSYIDHLFDDHACTWLCTTWMRRVYGAMETVFSRSREFVPALRRLDIPDEKIEVIPHGIKTEEFDRSFRDEGVWDRLAREEGYAGIEAPAVRAIFVSRVSVEKNAPLLTRIWKRVGARCRERGLDARLVVVGDGPYKARMEDELRGTDAHFLGFRTGRPLATLYASADLFVFPSVTETLGQVVMEAQCAGLPAVVADEGGPAATVAHGETGYVLPAGEPERWVDAVVGLIEDAGLRRRMGEEASRRMLERDIGRSFEHFWDAHERAVTAARGRTT